MFCFNLKKQIASDRINQNLYNETKIEAMEQNFWRNKLNVFLVKHPLYDMDDLEIEEEIYTPRENLKIRFWFEGNLQVEGSYNELEINYNSPDLLVLIKESNEVRNIYRVLWSKLICFELIIGSEANQKLKDLVRLN